MFILLISVITLAVCLKLKNSEESSQELNLDELDALEEWLNEVETNISQLQELYDDLLTNYTAFEFTYNLTTSLAADQLDKNEKQLNKVSDIITTLTMVVAIFSSIISCLFIINLTVFCIFKNHMEEHIMTFKSVEMR